MNESITSKSNKSHSSKARLTEGPVGPLLIRFALPMIVGILSILLTHLVDTLYIGQLGVRELAAVSFTFPVTFIVISMAFGIGIGLSALVARAIGEGNHQRVKRLTTDGILLVLTLVLTIVIVGTNSIEPTFSMMGADAEMIPLIKQYMVIWYLGVGFVVVPMVGNSSIRATGDSRSPSMIMLVVAVVNAVLDPLLIFGIGPFPRMEIQGAALATLISHAMALAAGLWLLHVREQMIDWSLPRISEVIRSWSEILHIGFPAMLTNLLIPAGNAILTRMSSPFGPAAVAAFGVGNRIESLTMIGVLALTSVFTPFVGQNWGAGHKDRIQEGLSFAFRFSLLWGGGVCILLALTAPWIGMAFTDNGQALSLIKQFLWIVPVSFGMQGISQLTSSACNALLRPLQATTIQLVRVFLLVIPFAYFGSSLLGATGVFAGISLGNAVIGLMAWSWLRHKLVPVALRNTGKLN